MPRPSGAVYGYLPFREVRILPGRAFCSIGINTFTLHSNAVFPIEEQSVLRTLSRVYFSLHTKRTLPRPSGAVYGYLPFREVRILPGRTFCSIGISTFTLYNNTVFPIEQKSVLLSRRTPFIYPKS